MKSEAGYFFIMGSTDRARIVSKRVLDSWAPHRVVNTSEAALKNYRITSRLRFRNGSLIWNLADGRIYMIENGKRRWVKSPDVLELIGAKAKDVVAVSNNELILHSEGDDLE